jgi:heme-degrading monooxygenase HmoA
VTVKIIIERTAKPDQQDELLLLLKDLRSLAIHQPGYIAGETLTSVDRSGMHLVISTWHSLNDWRSWENNPQRTKISAQIEHLLASPSKVGVFVEPWASLPEGI